MVSFFEKICFLRIKAQTDPNFIFLIVIGDSLPKPHKQRLLERVPQAVPPPPNGPHRQMLQTVQNQFQDYRRPCLHFRHDDDDTLAFDYVAKLRQPAEDYRAYLTRHRRLTVDFNHDFIGGPDAKEFQVKPIF